jgi:hypothetical protein
LFQSVGLQPARRPAPRPPAAAKGDPGAIMPALKERELSLLTRLCVVAAIFLPISKLHWRRR